MSLRVGVISDTHGLLRPEALRALAGVDRIVHAGDGGAWAAALPRTEARSYTCASSSSRARPSAGAPMKAVGIVA